MSEAIQLNAREELILRALEMTEAEARTILKLIERLEDVEDAADIAAHKGEAGIPIEDLIKDLGFTVEEIEATAKAQGWM